MDIFNYKNLLGYHRTKPMRFSQFVEGFIESPNKELKTSASIILDAIKHFGFEIVVRSGEPVLHYKIFNDLFSNGINAVYGQEHCIKRVIDVIESVDKESGPKRGIVMVGPPASGKTNIVDLISQALEEYSKQDNVNLYSFFIQLENDQGRTLELRSALMPNPILLFPITLQLPDGSVTRPREELFNYIKEKHRYNESVKIPTYYQYATMDKRIYDILETLMQNPMNDGMSLFEIVEKYVRIEKITYSNVQGKGIANIDDMKHLQAYVRPFTLSEADINLLNEHLQGKFMFKYEGSLLQSNRGLLHIHDAFGLNGANGPNELDYKPLLMLLGSGKISLESTQAHLDNTTIMTTNLEEMESLENQLTSSKLLDRIEKVPVNYLLDSISEMDILKRDMANMQDKYDVDPNLFRIASYYSVMTRLFSPDKNNIPGEWSNPLKKVYQEITPEQKLFIYSVQSDDPIQTIRKLPPWHPFRNVCVRHGIDIYNSEQLNGFIRKHPSAVRLEDTGLFESEQLHYIDDEFMRQLRQEHYPQEGKWGLSIRQLQNIMRNTISHSDGRKISVSQFINQLEKIIMEGPTVHHWLTINNTQKKAKPIPARQIDDIEFKDNEGNYGDYKGLIKVIKAIYFTIIRQEITVSTVDRDPKRIEEDLRKYLQHSLLDKAIQNKAFAHIIVPRYTYIDSNTGKKIDEPDYDFLKSIESILEPNGDPINCRKMMAQKFLDALDSGDVTAKEGTPIVHASDDNLLVSFSKEYTQLISHRRAMDGIDDNQLRDAFFHKVNDEERYSQYSNEIKQFVEGVIKNMTQRFSYSKDIALDTIIYALRKNIIDFSEIIT
ncbi:hypothetical protein JYT61_00305 [bacterium AH-315-E10]|nr:hypothetical protein [bacterium AH-315-E10]